MLEFDVAFIVSFFSRNYNVMVVNAPCAEMVAERSEEMKQYALLSRSL